MLTDSWPTHQEQGQQLAGIMTEPISVTCRLADPSEHEICSSLELEPNCSRSPRRLADLQNMESTALSNWDRTGLVTCRLANGGPPADRPPAKLHFLKLFPAPSPLQHFSLQHLLSLQ